MINKMLIFFVVVLAVVVNFSGCVEEEEDTYTFIAGDIYYTNLTIEDLEIDTENLPNMGSSTSAHPLAILIGCKILNISYLWTDELSYPYNYGGRISIGNITHLNVYQYPIFGYTDTETYLIPNATDPGKEYIAENITNKIRRTGTHGSYVELIEGNLSIIIAARLPSEDELNLATNYSVELVTKPLALDAFVFILNYMNPTENLTVDQIKKIYTGNITDWINISDNSMFLENYSKISAYQRNDNSGSQELMKTLVMVDLEMIDEKDMVSYAMWGPYDRLAYDEYGIAYTVYFYKKFMAPFYYNVKFCGVDGFYPCYDTIYNQTYPYTTEVYVVIKKDLDVNSTAYKLRDWLLGIDGQEVVKESGYVPII